MNYQLNSFFCASKKHHIVIYKSLYEKICDSHRFITKIIDVIHFYLFFNVSLLNLIDKLNVRITVIDFVNDINLVMYSKFTEMNCVALKKIHDVCV